jgi:RES domain-containing protein
VKAFRIANAKHTVFDGTGSERFGARWNSAGRKVIYGADSFALAMLERLANTATGEMPIGDNFIEIEIPEAVAVETFNPSRHSGWDGPTKAQTVSRAFGDRWYDEGRSAVLVVPSAVTKLDRNLVINPKHPQFKLIKASAEKPVTWDRRLFGGGKR